MGFFGFFVQEILSYSIAFKEVKVAIARVQKSMAAGRTDVMKHRVIMQFAGDQFSFY